MTPLQTLRHHVSGAIERGESTAIVEIPVRVTPDDFTRIPSDVNGNPRYAIHFLRLLTDDERADRSLDSATAELALAEPYTELWA